MTTLIVFLCTVGCILYWHFNRQIPAEYIFIEGEIESYQHKSDFYIRPRFIERLNAYALSGAKNVIFHTRDNERIAFKKIIYKNGLWRQLGIYPPNELRGYFCLMRQHGTVYLFAYSDSNSKVALSNDLYFPQTLGGKIKTALKLFLGIGLIFMLISSIGSLLFIIPSKYVGSIALISFPLVYGYFIYFNLFSKYPKEIYKKQVELIKKAGMVEPII